MTEKGTEKEIDKKTGMITVLKKMTPILVIYLVINVGYSYYQFGIIKNKNFDVITPVFVISSAIYWIILLYYDYKYSRRVPKI